MSQATATPKQIDFIMSLIAERAERNNVPDAQAVRDALVQQRLTKTGASAMIDTLLAQPKDAPKVDPAAAPVDAAPEVRSNRYAGKCGNCGKQVPVGAGRIERVNGRWVTFHLDGVCPSDLQSKLNAAAADLPTGYYAIPFIGEGARTDLTFLGLRRKNDGDVFIVHVVGGHGETDDMSFEWSMKAIRALKTTDLKAARMLYGRELGHCGECGRTLTNQESRAMGIGPECATKY